MVLVEPEVLRDALRDCLAVAGQHDRAADTLRLQALDRLLRVRLLHVGDVNMAGVDAVNRYMNNRSRRVAAFPFCADSIHHFRIADTDRLSIDNGANSLSRDFLDMLHAAAIVLMAEGCAERNRNRVRRIPLDMRREMKQLMLIKLVRMKRRDLKHALCQRSRLVKDNRIGLRERIDEGGALDQHAILRRGADAAEK